MIQTASEQCFKIQDEWSREKGNEGRRINVVGSAAAATTWGGGGKWKLWIYLSFLQNYIQKSEECERQWWWWGTLWAAWGGELCW